MRLGLDTDKATECICLWSTLPQKDANCTHKPEVFQEFSELYKKFHCSTFSEVLTCFAVKMRSYYTRSVLGPSSSNVAVNHKNSCKQFVRERQVTV